MDRSFVLQLGVVVLRMCREAHGNVLKRSLAEPSIVNGRGRVVNIVAALCNVLANNGRRCEDISVARQLIDWQDESENCSNTLANGRSSGLCLLAKSVKLDEGAGTGMRLPACC